MSEVRPVPEGFHTITAHLTVADAAKAIAFYTEAFGAEEVVRMPGPGGKVMHAEMSLGDSRLLLNDEFPDVDVRGPAAIGGTPVTLHLYVPDIDAFVARAEKAGAKVTLPVQDTFWGDRYGRLEDPFGHSWAVATRTKNMTLHEMREASRKAMEG